MLVVDAATGRSVMGGAADVGGDMALLATATAAAAAAAASVSAWSAVSGVWGADMTITE